MEINLTLADIITLIGELGVLVGVLTPMFVNIKKIKNGTRCQLRSDMLSIYYRYKKNKAIPQFEYENFMALHGSYKALKGNSFIDKIHKDIQTWEISTEEDDIV